MSQSDFEPLARGALDSRQGSITSGGIPGTVLEDGAGDAARVADSFLAAALSPRSPGLETFRLLRARVEDLARGRALQCIGIVSARRREGVSTVALGLAAALAQEPGHRVLVLEANLRDPSVGPALGLAAGPGFGDWLESRGQQAMLLRRLEAWGFWLIAGGQPAPASAGRLGSEQVAGFLTEARRSFEFVVVDCPPLESLADSVILQDLLDGFLLVVRERHTPRETIRRAIPQIRPELICGVVFNDHREIIARWLDRRSRREAR